ncbi:MAG: membrane protein insertion efficiency factor YidD [Weeksellaceae bacterium]
MKKVTLAVLKFYQKTSWFHHQLFRTLYLSDQVCRFSPTCSQYMYDAVEKYGSLKGIWLGLKRISRCHPWSQGGFDPVK